MPDIVTVTFNPALDVSSETDAVRPTDKLRCTVPHFDPGGGGVNVARMAVRLGADALALAALGGPTGDSVRRLLEEEGVAVSPIAIAGRTRESLAIRDRATGEQYRFSFPGPRLSHDEIESMLETVFSIDPPPMLVVLSGSLPPGVPPSAIVRIARWCTSENRRLVIDSSSAKRSHIAGIGAYLIKPNLRELESLVGRTLSGEQTQIAAARQLVDEDCCAWVALSRGARGALLVGRDRAVAYPALPVRPVSAIGAGDSMVAGIVTGLGRGWDIEEAMRLGVAAGTAALLTPDTELANSSDVEQLRAQVESRDITA